jgi:hypothetical protein
MKIVLLHQIRPKSKEDFRCEEEIT